MRTNVVYQGDCIQGLKRLPDKSVDLILTDPPYNVSKAEWDIDVLDLLDNCAKECSRIIKTDGLILWFVPTKYMIQIGNIICKYIPYRWQFIWYMPNRIGGLASIGFSKYTSVLIFSNAKSVHKNMQDIRVSKWEKMKEHPTPKPKNLIRYLVKNCSNDNDLILDPFMGSGTTALACKQLNRRWVGFEISPEYCKIIQKRLSQKVITGFFDTQAHSTNGSFNKDLTGNSDEFPQILPLAELR